ncbi:MAG: hypothetical protein AAFQ80_24145 [Cyanobacteria bacterium J06621_8]
MLKRSILLFITFIFLILAGCEKREFEIDNLTIRINEDLSGFVKLFILPPSYKYKDDYYSAMEDTGEYCEFTWEKSKNKNNKHGLLYSREFNTMTDLNESINCAAFDEMSFKVETSESFLAKKYKISFLIPDIKALKKEINVLTEETNEVTEGLRFHQKAYKEIRPKLPTKINSLEDHIAWSNSLLEIEKKYLLKSEPEAKNRQEALSKIDKDLKYMLSKETASLNTSSRITG